MKLKSLLLGSAAVLALSTGAQAADPIAEFVSLGVCDAYGITGVTIDSGDTCLKISGEVSYEYILNNDEDTAFDVTSDLSWELGFEAVTQTDTGAARAVFTLEDDVEGDPATAGDDVYNVVITEAYVSFGDTTVLSAGLMDSIFELRDDGDLLDWGYDFDDLDAAGQFGSGGHGISLSTLIADGFTFTAALEDLNQDDGEWGTAGFAVGYANGGITANAGVLIGDLYDEADETLYFVDASGEFAGLTVLGSIGVTDDGDFLGLFGGSYDFDLFEITAQVAGNGDDEYGVGAEVAFDATDEIVITATAEYWDGLDVGDLGAGQDELFQTSLEVGYQFTENLLIEAGIGYFTAENTGGGTEDGIYGTGGITYEPGGNFETSLDGEIYDNGDYTVTFAASKSF